VVSDEPALRPPLIETGIIRELGGESFVWRVREGDAAAGHMIKDLELPREALVNLIVRRGAALPPRASTEIEEGDELHIVARLEALDEVQRLAERWRDGPLGRPEVPALPPRGAPQVFSVRPWKFDRDGDPGAPEEIEGILVAQRLRVRRDGSGALVVLADGRYAATGADVLAFGGRRRLAEWCARRVSRPGTDAGERAWWQELAGALSAPATPPDAAVSEREG
jgi:cell volume regulation protein A